MSHLERVEDLPWHKGAGPAGNAAPRSALWWLPQAGANTQIQEPLATASFGDAYPQYAEQGREAGGQMVAYPGLDRPAPSENGVSAGSGRRKMSRAERDKAEQINAVRPHRVAAHWAHCPAPPSRCVPPRPAPCTPRCHRSDE